ncbi:LacI family DNA-binding transcriptional regulator [Celeribacter indicus]|uniref:LacI family transcriptional regulator n=1 Tax=Celeribacter indicus TaxID=1208324 RepID=A0A0B5E882_9RHOB|nr:LacI family DNA-binding transcriptional regulator [Celeribacter indicus]AJE49226.1 LacI family transcriptional regulator [Celeribacter indicus]SDX51994.1 transcriptional regulator, LacI family [Celeribacter indicus]
MRDPVKPPRIHDVAKLAGVSVATVSRVLSNPAIVSETTRIAVEKAVAETGYRVNLTARNLRQQQVGAVLALVPNLANPFFSEILSGISRVLREEGMNLLVLDTRAHDGQPDMKAVQPYLTRSHADGVLVLDGGLDPEPFRAPSCPPVLQACEWIEGLGAPRVFADNEAGARLAIDHLAGLGHRRIAHLTGPAENCLTVARAQGVASGIAAAGLPSPARFEGDFKLRSGAQAAQAFLAMADRPTAIFCDNDEMALGLLHGLVRGGLRVPEDISVVGFDNLEMSAYALPPLTTIRQRRARIGNRAAELLLKRRRESLGDGYTEVMPVELILRESTAPPAQG